MILEGKNMIARYEQVGLYSKKEYKRRADLVRSEMKKKSVDVVLMLACTNESHDHWLTGREFLDYVIVPAEGEIIGVLLDEIDESAYEENLNCLDFDRYVYQREFTTDADGIRFVNRVSDVVLAELIRDLGGKRIGLVNPRHLTCSMDDALRKTISDLQYVDMTKEIDIRKTVKSKEELECIRMSAEAQGQMMDALEHMLRPGRRYQEVRMEVRDQIVSLGGSGVMLCVLLYLGDQNEVCPKFDMNKDDFVLKEGDTFFSLMEGASYGGHCVAMGRNFIVGKATEEYKESVELNGKLNLYAASMMKPGTTLRQIVTEVKNYVMKNSGAYHRCCWMHGLSTANFMEQYSVQDISFDWPLEEGVVLHCHPYTKRHMPWLGAGAYEDMRLLNTYVVTPEGGKSLVNLEKHPFGLVETGVD